MNMLKINRLPVFAIYVLLIPFYVLAQSENGIINSGELIKKGIEAHDAEKYDEALSFYNQVHENDTNYGLATVEKAFSYYSKKDYANAIKFCEEALKIGTDFDKNLYITLGSSYDESGNSEKAIEVYNKGISEFPKNYLILFNKAVTLEKQEKYQQAVNAYQNTIEINPFHSTSHLRLGRLAEQEGELAKAILCYNTFLILEPASDRSLSVLNFLDIICSKKYDTSETKGIKLSAVGDDFKEIETLLRKQLALNSNYKLESKADFPAIRQNQALLSYLINHKGKEGFWEKNYVPFYAKIYNDNLFETFSYFLLLSSTNEKVKVLVNKNKSDLTKFVDWKVNQYTELVSKKNVEIDGKMIDAHLLFYKDGNLYGHGPINAAGDKKNGKWEFFHANGKLMAKGNFDNNGTQTGLWIFYYSDGKLKRETSFTNDLETGVYKLYHRNGNITEQGTKKAGKLDGEIKVYTIYGGLSELHNFKDDVQQGNYEEYHHNGKLQFTASYKDGKLEGPIKSFHPDGTLSLEGTMKDGNKEGKFITYYRNGQVQQKKYYVLNKEDGTYIKYYKDGKISEEGNVKNENLIGIYKTYFLNGTVDEINNINDDGKLDGKQQYFDMDGKLYYEADYKNGKLLQYRYFDKSGKNIYEAKLKPKQEVKTFFSDGNIRWTGTIEDGERVGLWKEYFRNGLLKGEYKYKHGKLDGLNKEYYMNGKVYKEVEYKDNSFHGRYRAYHRNGQLYHSAWYDNGVGYGDVYYYRSNGMSDTKYYVYKDELKGKYYNYDVTGKLQSVDTYESDLFVKYSFYDTTGNIFKTVDIDKEKMDAAFYSPTGKATLFRQYINGSKEGTSKSVYLTGRTENEGIYLNDKREGIWTWYYPDNRINAIRNYESGKLNGLNENYDLFGNIRSRYNYLDGELHGVGKLFYYNGIKREEAEYFDGDEHGTTKIFSFDGVHILSLVYEYGFLKKIIYPEKADTTDAPLNGIIEAKFTNGKTAWKYSYKNALLNGKAFEYFDDGSPCREIDYLDGLLYGERKTWYKNGKLCSIEKFSDDDREGLTTIFYESGSKKAEFMFKEGLFHGPVKYYDTFGKLIAHYEFYNDYMIKIVL